MRGDSEPGAKRMNGNCNCLSTDYAETAADQTSFTTDFSEQATDQTLGELPSPIKVLWFPQVFVVSVAVSVKSVEKQLQLPFQKSAFV
jgi:hypothetical protein